MTKFKISLPLKIIAVLLGVAAYISAILYAATPTRQPQRYSTYATVVEIDRNVITVVDDDGNSWMYYSKEITLKGDLIRLIFNDNATDKIEDDKIIHAYNLSNLTRS